jgi:membrane carboxypeptidase/penicillin-binding protein
MRPALASRPPLDFPQPEAVISLIIDPTTGLAANSGCPEKRKEFYLSGTEPASYCKEHGGIPMQPLPVSFSIKEFVGPPELPQGPIKE